ncbi:MAG: SLBB domain-containing protein [candidate division Zixibacteria bacterium]|nr:SLBB domain-containing protein [candidate division Zixibacteria bacterium]
MRFFCFILIFTVTLAALPAAAQSPGGDDTLGLITNYRFYDEPVKPELYIVRPGEKLLITFLKTKLPQLWLQVNPEGKLIDKNLGMFDIAGRSLSEMRAILAPPLKALFNAEEIDISVREPYQVGVAVAGEVAEPDIYLGYTSFLCSELLALAGGVTVDGSTRNIRFYAGEKELRVDLDRVRFMGDNSFNPCLYAGYRLFVPRKANDIVNVVGEVNFPRAIELLPGDDLKLLISLAGGTTELADIAAAFVTGAPDRDITRPGNLRPGDVIMVPARKDVSSEQRLLIFGLVNKPGRYQYRPGIILSELINAAGGLNEKANFENTAVFRKVEKSAWVSAAGFRFPINRYSLGEANFKNCTLKPDDSVFVPPSLGFVKVSGFVRHPGFFPFMPGKTALNYINLAGDFQKNADRGEVKIYDRISKTTRSSGLEATVNDGDEIIIEAIESKP